MTDAIIPSSLWQGTPVEASRWTAEQIATLMKLGRDPVRVETIKVQRRAKVHPEDWTRPAPVETLTLPRLGFTRDRRRAKVIAPAGAEIWMDVGRG